MGYLSAVVFLFSLGASVGWLLELVYRRIAHGRWINPGFLVGPCLPLYGSGVLLLYLLCSLKLSFVGTVWLRECLRVLIITLTLTAIEYVTGVVFTKYYHVRLWDYSSRPGNIDGQICPLFSFIWGALGAAYAFFLHGRLVAACTTVAKSPVWLFLSGIYVGVFLVDCVYSLGVVRNIKRFAEEHKLQIRYEHLKLSVAERAKKLRVRQNFVFPLGGSAERLRASLEGYINTLREKTSKTNK